MLFKHEYFAFFKKKTKNGVYTIKKQVFRRLRWYVNFNVITFLLHF
jgi:hypothetical protein